MRIAQYDATAYNQGVAFLSTATTREIDELKMYGRGIISMAKPDKSDEIQQMAKTFCRKYSVTIANDDCFGSFISFVAGANSTIEPLGDGANYFIE